MNFLRHVTTLAVMCFWLSGSQLIASHGNPLAASETFPTDKLVILSQGQRLEFIVEVASSYPERKAGLMFRRTLDKHAGMLFDYGTSQKVAMWMRNTYLPLDIIFIDKFGVIRNIATDTVPLSLTPIPSNGPVLGVLELNAGTSMALHIKPGDIVLNRIFGNMAQ